MTFHRPRSTLFPYTTLFRSQHRRDVPALIAQGQQALERVADDGEHRPLCGECETPTALVERPPRSEEHTSELQSHSDLVCRLLLEKKKGESEQILTPDPMVA